uniref:Zinc finger (CCCH type) protein, putative n=1 Tax=Neospora caninum (strain Liverpool) TaxID=572307 RepID=A0A0F7U9V3_NEOCL|nr:TPA: zinc finger (CCCH type) protein, putative [Neospora caninum Liverpool]
MACAPLLTEDDLLRFRTKACLRLAQGSCSFGLDRCQYCHSSVWTRRSPFFPVGAHQQRNQDDRPQGTVALLRYLPVACSNLIVSDGNITAVPCHRGQSCPFAHSRDEIVYHPLLYKTEECDNHETSRCNTYYCWKAHGTKERRKPPKLRLGLIKGVDVQVFYPGITVVQLNSSGQKPISGKGKSSETSKGCGGGQCKVNPRRGSKAGPSKRDCEHMAGTSPFPVRNVEKTPTFFSCSDEAPFSFTHGAPALFQTKHLPTQPTVSAAAVTAALRDAAWEDTRQLYDRQALTDYQTAEATARFAGLLNLANVTGVPVSNSGTDAQAYSQKVAEMLQRSAETVIGINSKPAATGPHGPGEESDDRCVTVGNAAALIAVMRLQANWLLGKNSDMNVEECRAEGKHPKNFAEIASEEGYAEGDMFGCLHSAAVASSSPYRRTNGEFDRLPNWRRLAADQSHTVTRANSDGELLLSPGGRSSRQGSEQSCSRTVSTSGCDNTYEGGSFLQVPPAIKTDSAVDDEMPILDLARCESTWVRKACEGETQVASETAFNDAKMSECRPVSVQLHKHSSQLLEPRASDSPRLSAATGDTESRFEDGMSLPPRQIWAQKVIASRAVNGRDTRRLESRAVTAGSSIEESQIDGGRYTRRDGEEYAEGPRFLSSRAYGDKRQATDSTFGGSSRSASGEKLVQGDEIWGGQDALDVGANFSGGRPVSAIMGQQEINRGQTAQRNEGIETARPQLRQAVNALEFIKDGNAEDFKNDFLLAVTKELLKLVLGGDAHKATASEASIQRWHSNGIIQETFPHVQPNECPGEQSSVTPGLLTASNGVTDGHFLWSPIIKKRLDTHSAISSESDNTVWWP